MSVNKTIQNLLAKNRITINGRLQINTVDNKYFTIYDTDPDVCFIRTKVATYNATSKRFKVC